MQKGNPITCPCVKQSASRTLCRKSPANLNINLDLYASAVRKIKISSAFSFIRPRFRCQAPSLWNRLYAGHKPLFSIQTPYRRGMACGKQEEGDTAVRTPRRKTSFPFMKSWTVTLENLSLHRINIKTAQAFTQTPL